MKNSILKIFIALIVGLSVGQLSGVLNKKNNYFYINDSGPKEISKEGYCKNEFNISYISKTFNYEFAYLMGILTFAVIAIILLYPQIKQNNNITKKEQ